MMTMMINKFSSDLLLCLTTWLDQNQLNHPVRGGGNNMSTIALKGCEKLSDVSQKQPLSLLFNERDGLKTMVITNVKFNIYI